MIVEDRNEFEQLIEPNEAKASVASHECRCRYIVMRVNFQARRANRWLSMMETEPAEMEASALRSARGLCRA